MRDIDVPDADTDSAADIESGFQSEWKTKTGRARVSLCPHAEPISLCFTHGATETFTVAEAREIAVMLYEAVSTAEKHNLTWLPKPKPPKDRALSVETVDPTGDR